MMVLFIDVSLVTDYVRENDDDLFDIDSSYLVDFFFYVYVKVLTELLKLEDFQGKERDFLELENFESDDS